ncbi:MAG: EAL domain-containing protein [Clostridia bacterium]|nr:EAL domain-containing protein [Clostridia bacterium]
MMDTKTRIRIQNKYYTNANRYKLNVKWILPLFIIMLLLSFYGVNYVKNLTYENVYNNITELSEQTTAQLNLAISEQKRFIEIIIDSINSGFFDTPEDIFRRYNPDLNAYHFTRLVILDQNGNGTTSDGHTVKNYANIENYFAKANTTVYLAENEPSVIYGSEKLVNVYAKTFTLNNKNLILFATIHTEDYKEILLRQLFHGKGSTYLVNNNGLVLIDSSNNITTPNANFFEVINNSLSNHFDISKLDEMKNHMKAKQVGTFDLKLNKNTYFIHYEKVNTNDWYVITIAPDDTIAKELIQFLAIALVSCISITIIIIGICIFIDLSIQKKNRNLYTVAYIDPITKIGNEAYFKENAIKFLQNNSKSKYIIALDINKFKALNNIYGFEFCNKILEALAVKLNTILPEDNITCRISNDVFATIFSYTKDIETLLNKIFHDASNLKIANTSLHVNLSIGVYKLKQEDTDINKALDKAYMARSRIKGLYNDNYYIFGDDLENQLVEEQQIESCMEQALKDNEFVVVYQPKTAANTEKVVGAEALVRWHRNGQIIPPGKFIPLFEKNKFIVKLDLYIFEQACKDIASWKEKYGFVPIVSINVSKEHFVYENFIDEYVEITDKYGIDRSKIDLEITESATVNDKIDIIKVLNSIKEKGFVVSIDDFGTGYSSLSMLQNMPIDIIKIDKVFVDKANLESDKNIINYIVYLAKKIEVKTIVEGVETKEQAEYVKNLNCDVIQGYYYSKPISKEEFEEYFNKNR